MNTFNIELWVDNGTVFYLNELGIIPREGEVITISEFIDLSLEKKSYKVNKVEYEVVRGNDDIDIKLHVEEVV